MKEPLGRTDRHPFLEISRFGEAAKSHRYELGGLTPEVSDDLAVRRSRRGRVAARKKYGVLQPAVTAETGDQLFLAQIVLACQVCGSS